MIFSSKATAQGRRAVGGAVAAFFGALCLAVLASCGGGTTQYAAFEPQRLIVFGDDSSYIDPTGLKYNVNGLNASGVFDCTLEPIWVQTIAAVYGFAFAECNPLALTPLAIMRAGVGAEVADVTAQVEAQIAAGGFRNGDLATVLAGQNDILDLYSQYPGRTVDSLVAEAGARGQQLAAAVNRLVGLGVKVIVSDLPDQGLTPYAILQRATDPSGLDRAALLTQLSTAFNQQLGVNIIIDGRYVGLVQSELRFEAIARTPGTFDISDPLCTAPLPKCTTATIVPGATTTSYLWADLTHLATGGQAQLSTLAISRIRGNPF